MAEFRDPERPITGGGARGARPISGQQKAQRDPNRGGRQLDAPNQHGFRPVVDKAGKQPGKRQLAPQQLTDTPRQVDLILHRVDPWSVMKMTFLLCVALSIVMVFASILVWIALDWMQVFSSFQRFAGDVEAAGTTSSALGFLQLPRVVALVTVLAVINTVLITALAAVGAMVYNLIAALVGGVRVSFIDE